jgi:hypothetical protein
VFKVPKFESSFQLTRAATLRGNWKIAALGRDNQSALFVGSAALEPTSNAALHVIYIC